MSTEMENRGTPKAPPAPLEAVLAPRLAPDVARQAAMLEQLLVRAHRDMSSPARRLSWRLRVWLADYPWRMAFVLSTLQTAVCVTLFGNAYLQLLLQWFLPFHGVAR